MFKFIDYISKSFNQWQEKRELYKLLNWTFEIASHMLLSIEKAAEGNAPLHVLEELWGEYWKIYEVLLRKTKLLEPCKKTTKFQEKVWNLAARGEETYRRVLT